MTSRRSERVRRIFSEVCDLDPGERSRKLHELCGEEPDILNDVRRLLEIDSGADWLDEDDLEAVRTAMHGTTSNAEDASPPERLGPFAIEGVLGRGGMGLVYRARESHPERLVALKVLPPAASEEAAARFTKEARLLGRLQHPGIAQVFSAGTLHTGGPPRPYLAMELVEGKDLASWLRAGPARRLRIELLIAICQAVHHAHQKGVIHRDLKPTNILVDASGRPKVVDFGIARLVEDEEHVATRTGQVLGTLAYMSPEQAEGRAADVDTRSDVYSLGVIGYELLTDTLPIDVRQEPITRAIRRIVEEPPVPLARRDASLSGDLQTIVSCCLRKSPEARYSSAMALAEDLRRHLAHEPVLARDPSTFYILGRFARRHRWLLATVALVFLALSAALIVSLQANASERAARERENEAHAATRLAKEAAEEAAREAERELRIRGATLQFLSETFEKTDPRANPLARTMTPGQIFAQALADLDPRFLEEPAVEKSIRLEVGRLLVGFSEFELAIEQFERARAIEDPLDLPSKFQLEYELATALGESGRAQEAVDGLQAALERARTFQVSGKLAPHADEPLVENLRLALGQAHVKAGNRREAERVWSELLEDLEADPRFEETITLANLRSSLATLYVEDGRIELAEDSIRKALSSLRAERGEIHQSTLIALNNLAGIHFARGDWDSAAKLFRDALERARQVFGEDHRHVFDFTQNLATLEWRMGKGEQATVTLRRLIESAERAGIADTPVVCPPLSNLGKILWEGGKLEEAARCYERAIAIREASSPEADVYFSGFYNDLARIRKDQGRLQEHLELLRRSVALRIEALGPFHAKVLPRRVDLAAAELYTGKDPDAALTHLEVIDEHLVPTLGKGAFASTYSQQLLIECMLLKEERERAKDYLKTFEERSALERQPERWRPAIEHFRKALDE